MFDIVRHSIFRHDYIKGSKSSELSELYLSSVLLAIGLSLIGIFIPIYLWDKGFSLVSISGFFAIVYILRLYTDPISVRLTAKFGPKHLLTISYLVLIITLAMLVTIDVIGWPIALVAVFYGLFMSFYYIPFFYDLANVTDKGKEGKELSLIIIIRKLSGAIGPLLGGLIAWAFSIEATIYLAMIIILIAALPLFATAEFKKTNKVIKFSFMDIFKYKKHSAPFFAFGVETQINHFIWPLFAAVVVFSDQKYAAVGFIVASGLLISIAVSYVVGSYIDKKNGGILFVGSAFLASIINLVRPFVSTAVGAFGMSIVSEPIMATFGITFDKAYMASAKNHPREKLKFIASMILYMHLSRIILWVGLMILLIFFDDKLALQLSFVFAAVVLQFARFHNFKIYK